MTQQLSFIPPRPIENLIKIAADRLVSLIDDYRPEHIFSFFSGGHDSYTCTDHAVRHVLSGRDEFRGVVHIDTGIGIPETQDFVRERAAAHDWPLLIYRAMDNVRGDGTPDPQDYREICIKHGFPGPHSHALMYSRLKERQVRRVMRAYKGKVLFITGCRSEESRRRMGNAKFRGDRTRREVWCNSIYDWMATDCHRYMDRHELPRSPVKTAIGMSGECLCGAFGHPGELDEVRYHYPEAAARIDAIAAECKAAGVHHVWGTAPPAKPLDNGAPLFDDPPLCVGCGKRWEYLESEP